MIILNNEQTLWKFLLKGKHKHFRLLHEGPKNFEFTKIHHRAPMSSLGLVKEMGEGFMDRSMDDHKATALEDQYPAKTMASPTTT